MSVAQERLTSPWTSLVHSFPGGDCSNVALLTDGRILCEGQDFSSQWKQWWTLAPDSTGNYVNQSWVQVGSSILTGRIFDPSFEMRDGRYWLCGGEYVDETCSAVTHTCLWGAACATSGDCHQSPHSECEIFDPVANTWSVSAPLWKVGDPTLELVDDTPAALLADGRVMVLQRDTPLANGDSWLYDPRSNIWSPAAPYDRSATHGEGGSLLLPDGSVLFGWNTFMRYLPSSNTWVPTGATPGSATGEFLSTPAVGDNEIGPLLLLHSGKALQLGGNRHNGIYTPPATLTDPGTWALAADTPLGPNPTVPLNNGDVPATVEPNGKVLTAATQDQNGNGSASPFFYEYDPTLDVPGGQPWSAVASPSTGFNDTSRIRMLNLPNGQIFVSGPVGQAWLYTPTGAPAAAWRPAISSVSPPIFGQVWLSGTQLNGLTTGADMGDDAKMATNYPLVSFSTNSADTTGVSYLRTGTFDQMAPRPGVVGYLQFATPALASGSYFVHVAANGVSSSSTVTYTLPQVDVGPALVAAQVL